MKQLMLPPFALVACLLAGGALARDPMEYGRAYLAEGEHAAAADSYAEVLKVNPFDPVALNNLAVARAANGDYQTARDLFARAARLAPERSDIRANLDSLQSWLDTTGGVAPARIAPARTASLLPEPPPLWPLVAGSSSNNSCLGGACR